MDCFLPLCAIAGDVVGATDDLWNAHQFSRLTVHEP